MYLSILDSESSQIEIEKSRFIASLFHVVSSEDAKYCIEKVRKNNPKADHNCYAYIIDNNNYRTNDDGEPASSAGIPILEVLKSYQLEKCLIVVTRYFGGTKLGVGGLIRAYQSAASGVIKKSQIVRVNNLPIYGFKIDYNLVDIINNFLRKNQITILTQVFDIQVQYKIIVENEEILALLNNTLQGKVEINYIRHQDVVSKV